MKLNDTDFYPLIDKIGIGRVLVTGDVMLDQYWYGTTSRISPEAPVPVVKVRQSEFRPGGSANVAMNVGSLGVACDLVAITGNDPAASKLKEKLQQFNITTRFQKINNANTISKLRIISQNQQLIRIDHEDEWPRTDRKEIEQFFEESLGRCDVAVISDYDKGTLASTAEWVGKAIQMGKPVVIDPKGSDFEKYRGATLITPNFKEFEQVAGKCGSEEDIFNKAARMVHALDLNALLVTRGDKGMTLVPRVGAPIHVPAQAREVYDVTGAGDTVVAVVAACIAAGFDLECAVRIANYAAGVVVSKLGTAFVTKAEIKAAVKRDMTISANAAVKGIMTPDSLMEALRAARRRGEKIVMTNGCFDILHPGHVRYLEKARQLGDRLIVAVNSDRSVRRLKGATRPVNPASVRMEMLGALASTDWIVEFDEDTPARLIEQILPDILVKGGDYAVPEIAGAETVMKNGGQVILIDFIEGFSTTHMIRKIRE